MSDTDLKIITALISVISVMISAIISAVVGVIIYFWGEGRRRYYQAISGIRVIIISSQMLESAIRYDRRNVAEIKIELIAQYLEGFFRNGDAYKILSEIISLQFEWMSGNAAFQEKARLIQKVRECTEKLKNCLDVYEKSWKRIFYIAM